MKVSVYVGTSVDGFIAREDGGIDWLNEANACVPEGEDCGFQAFMDGVDVLVMGRKTFEQVLSFGQWPYGEIPVVVLSHKAICFPPHVPATVSHSSEPLPDLLSRLQSEGAERLYVDGGTTIHGFLAENLVDEITVTVVPIALGSGIPLFGLLRDSLKLSHVRTRAYEFGFVQTTYAVERAGQ